MQIREARALISFVIRTIRFYLFHRWWQLEVSHLQPGKPGWGMMIKSGKLKRFQHYRDGWDNHMLRMYLPKQVMTFRIGGNGYRQEVAWKKIRGKQLWDMYSPIIKAVMEHMTKEQKEKTESEKKEVGS